MITPAFTKLQRSLITSSIWLQDDHTRLVWVTLLALCERDGIARCSPLGLAHQARVPPDACKHALEVLEQPDEDSRSPMHDGRRIERCEAGFRVLNYARVLSEGITEERREYERKKKAVSRARKKKGKGLMAGISSPAAPPERETPPEEPSPFDAGGEI